MKYIILIFVLTICTLWYCDYGDAVSTYSSQGIKKAVATCDADNKRECIIKIGQVCEDDGFTIVKEENIKDDLVIEAECSYTK